jgi:alpha-L-fucosidase
MNTLKITLGCFLFFSLFNAVQPAAQNNFAFIRPGDDSLAIIKKAAAVVPSKRQLEWQQWERTGFLHFGVNTFTGKEWGDGKENPAIFNPTDFDAEQWVRIAKKAGIELLIITAKHHDGFCLWPTATTEHSVKNSPFKKDIVQELSIACKKAGMRFGFYLSPWDRNSPLYGTDQYNDFFVAQLTELVTEYGKIDEVWFDGANGEGPNGKKQHYDFPRYYEVIRQHQPKAVIAISGPDVRWVGTETGYGRDTEWSVVPVKASSFTQIVSDKLHTTNLVAPGDMMETDLGSRKKIQYAEALAWYPAETDVSIRPGWFYHEKEDSLVKSADKLLDIYFNSIGKNGVLLLNIPPDKRGRIHEADSAALIQWNLKIKEIFSNNLLLHARSSLKNTRRLFDDNYKTTIQINHPLPYEFIFSTPQQVRTNIFMIQEDISKGQKVEAFSVWVKKGTEWQKITAATTIGYKRILEFDEVTGSEFKIIIEAARGGIVLSQLGLYYNNTKK